MSDALEKSKEMTKRLHALIRMGRGDSTAADRIRDETDPLWYDLTDEEQEELRDFSEGLYEEHEKKLAGTKI